MTCFARLRSHLITLGALAGCALAAPPIPDLPTGPGQIKSPITLVPDPSPPVDDPQRHFALQRTPNAKLVLTASNGFFDSGIIATGEAETKDAAGREFIDPDFAALEEWTKPGLSARWHLWIESPGQLHTSLEMIPSAGTAEASFTLELAGSDHSLTTPARKDSKVVTMAGPSLAIPQPGWHTLTLRLDDLKGTDAGQIRQINLWGPAAEGSGLLRTRWRPAACHARFSSSQVEKPSVWVMSTRPSPDAGTTSYSPVTTPFGYYGCSFKSDGTATGSANFSLWSYGRGKPTPQDRWSHMLASGSPLATFGSFGHEGSGVKLRGDWKPFADAPVVTLALRCEVARPWTRWFGYYLDPQTHRFRFYAAASKWLGDSRRAPSLNPGAFVEQPGPPQRRRGGDLVRDVHRRGWMLDDQQRWKLIDRMSSGKSDAIAPKHWGTTPDQWFSMGMGGIPHRPGPGKAIQLEAAANPLPDWLDDRAISDLHRLPATLGTHRIPSLTRDSATIDIPITLDDPNDLKESRVRVFYGTEDCLTFERDLGFRETKTRYWQHQTDPTRPRTPITTIALQDLSPGSRYFFRVLVDTPNGSIWSFDTDSFTTPE